jgi:hypothetical protein
MGRDHVSRRQVGAALAVLALAAAACTRAADETEVGAAAPGGDGGSAATATTPDAPTDTVLMAQFRFAIPVLLLFVVLLALPESRLRGHSTRTSREVIPRPAWPGAWQRPPRSWQPG